MTPVALLALAALAAACASAGQPASRLTRTPRASAFLARSEALSRLRGARHRPRHLQDGGGSSAPNVSRGEDNPGCDELNPGLFQALEVETSFVRKIQISPKAQTQTVCQMYIRNRCRTLSVTSLDLNGITHQLILQPRLGIVQATSDNFLGNPTGLFVQAFKFRVLPDPLEERQDVVIRPQGDVLLRYTGNGVGCFGLNAVSLTLGK